MFKATKPFKQTVKFAMCTKTVKCTLTLKGRGQVLAGKFAYLPGWGWYTCNDQWEAIDALNV